MAAKLSVEPEQVSLTASAGSVVVFARVQVPDAATASAATLALTLKAPENPLVDKETFGAFEVTEVAVAKAEDPVTSEGGDIDASSLVESAQAASTAEEMAHLTRVQRWLTRVPPVQLPDPVVYNILCAVFFSFRIHSKHLV